MEFRQETGAGDMSVPNVATCFVAMDPDRRHPIKAGAQYWAARLMSTETSLDAARNCTYGAVTEAVKKDGRKMGSDPSRETGRHAASWHPVS